MLKRLEWIFFLVGPLVTLAVSPWTNYDPINLIKILICSSLAFYSLGLIISSSKKLFVYIHRKFFISIIFFVLCLLNSFLFSGAPFNQQLWGSFGRNTGLITYLSLAVIAILGNLIGSISNSKKFIDSLTITSALISFYCLIQILGLDPIGWSLKDTFATLGNINFLSAFLGLSSSALLIEIFLKRANRGKQSLYLLLLVSQVVIIYSTGSIQGLMMFVASLGLVGFLWLRSRNYFRFFKYPYLFLSGLAIYLTTIALFNKGPLANDIFQPSVIFRADYMHAGWVMTIQHPLTGVGLDSFGDWYRSARGLISTTRNDPNRIANTAHNIFLDISSNGGFPLLFAYLAIQVVVLFYALRILKYSKFPSPSVAVVLVWIVYQIQSLISINQIGVGIWGWMAVGFIVGQGMRVRNSQIENEAKKIEKNFGEKRRSNSKNLASLSPSQMLAGLTLGFVGFIFAFMPFKGDMDFKTAMNTGKLLKVIESVKKPYASAFHAEIALEQSLKGNYVDQSKILTDYLLSRYPRDFMAWRAKSVISSYTETERKEAKEKAISLDPYNPQIK